ncbi:hypothetical protein HDU96_009731 [Phlyctochytrium bullatum]|nr:hypothetical protein HDU96_009731 [Phlyctochytrium bullatum]
MSRDSVVELKIHAAITCGECDKIIVGNTERLDYFVMSQCIYHLGPALDAAASGEIGFSYLAWEGLELPQKNFCCKSHTFGPDVDDLVYVVQPKILSWLRDVIDADGAEYYKAIAPYSGTDDPLLFKFINQSHMRYILRWTKKSPEGGLIDSTSLVSGSNREIPKMQEYRQVSVVFVRIKSTRAEIRLVQNITLSFLDMLQAGDGSFRQISVDDKGLTWMGLFGLPPWPPKKEQTAAINACLNFLTRARSLLVDGSFSLTISISSGTVLFSEVGNQFRRDTSLLGDFITIAARMMCLEEAENKIVCDASTMVPTESEFTFKKLGDFLFKGKTLESEVFQVVSSRNAKSGEEKEKEKTNVFGYEKPKELIKSAVNLWSTNRKGGALVLQGASGIGKSTLVKHFIDECNQKDILWLDTSTVAVVLRLIEELPQGVGRQFNITMDGLLILADSGTDFDSLFAADVATAIKSQFDRNFCE